jgi:hypothetical protein
VTEHASFINKKISTVHFPTRITNISATSIDNIFIDGSRNYTIKPHINGLSDHDAQLLILENVVALLVLMRLSSLETSINIAWRNFNPFLAGNYGKTYLGLMTLILCSINFLTPILDATTPVLPKKTGIQI